MDPNDKRFFIVACGILFIGIVVTYIWFLGKCGGGDCDIPIWFPLFFICIPLLALIALAWIFKGIREQIKWKKEFLKQK